MTTRSTAQIEASRRNGAHSRGPQSAGGKAVSAGNARRHGLCAKEFVLEDAAERAQFELFERELRFTYQAKVPLEVEACHQIAVAMWRLRVCNAVEQALVEAVRAGLACFEAGGDGLPSLNAVNRYRARIARDHKEAEARLETLKALRAEAFRAELTKAKEFASGALRDALRADLGDAGMAMVQAKLGGDRTNPSESQVSENVEESGSRPNREARRRAEAMARKKR